MTLIFENPRYRNGDFHVEKGVGVSGTIGLVFGAQGSENYTPLGIAPPMKMIRVYVFSVGALGWEAVAYSEGQAWADSSKSWLVVLGVQALAPWDRMTSNGKHRRWQTTGRNSMETRCRDGFSVEESWLTFYVHRACWGALCLTNSW